MSRALEINPHYVNGWLHLAQAKAMYLDFNGAKGCVKRALEADPTDSAAIAMKNALDSVT